MARGWLTARRGLDGATGTRGASGGPLASGLRRFPPCSPGQPPACGVSGHLPPRAGAASPAYTASSDPGLDFRRCSFGGAHERASVWPGQQASQARCKSLPTVADAHRGRPSSLRPCGRCKSTSIRTVSRTQPRSPPPAASPCQPPSRHQRFLPFNRFGRHHGSGSAILIRDTSDADDSIFPLEGFLRVRAHTYTRARTRACTRIEGYNGKMPPPPSLPSPAAASRR